MVKETNQDVASDHMGGKKLSSLQEGKGEVSNGSKGNEISSCSASLSHGSPNSARHQDWERMAVEDVAKELFTVSRSVRRAEWEGSEGDSLNMSASNLSLMRLDGCRMHRPNMYMAPNTSTTGGPAATSIASFERLHVAPRLRHPSSASAMLETSRAILQTMAYRTAASVADSSPSASPLPESLEGGHRNHCKTWAPSLTPALLENGAVDMAHLPPCHNVPSTITATQENNGNPSFIAPLSTTVPGIMSPPRKGLAVVTPSFSYQEACQGTNTACPSSVESNGADNSMTYSSTIFSFAVVERPPLSGESESASHATRSLCGNSDASPHPVLHMDESKLMMDHRGRMTELKESHPASPSTSFMPTQGVECTNPRTAHASTDNSLSVPVRETNGLDRDPSEGARAPQPQILSDIPQGTGIFATDICRQNNMQNHHVQTVPFQPWRFPALESIEDVGLSSPHACQRLQQSFSHDDRHPSAHTTTPHSKMLAISQAEQEVNPFGASCTSRIGTRSCDEASPDTDAKLTAATYPLETEGANSILYILPVFVGSPSAHATAVSGTHHPQQEAAVSQAAVTEVGDALDPNPNNVSTIEAARGASITGLTLTGGPALDRYLPHVEYMQRLEMVYGFYEACGLATKVNAFQRGSLVQGTRKRGVVSQNGHSDAYPTFGGGGNRSTCDESPSFSDSIGLERSAGYYSFGNRMSLAHPNRKNIPYVPVFLNSMTNMHTVTNYPRRAFTTSSIHSPMLQSTSTLHSSSRHHTLFPSYARKAMMDAEALARIECRPLLQTTLFMRYRMERLREEEESRQHVERSHGGTVSPSSNADIMGRCRPSSVSSELDVTEEDRLATANRIKFSSHQNSQSPLPLAVSASKDATTSFCGSARQPRRSIPASTMPSFRYCRVLTEAKHKIRHIHFLDNLEREVDNDKYDLVVHVGMILMGWLEVVELLGAGSFGQVFLCKDLRICDGSFVHPSQIKGDDFVYWNCCHAFLPFGDFNTIPQHNPLVAVKVVKSVPLLQSQSILEAEMLVLIGAQTDDSSRPRPSDLGTLTEHLASSGNIGFVDPPPPDPRCEYVSKVLADGICYGHHCIVMERYGENLFEYVAANKFRGLPMFQIRAIGRQLLSALTLLHERCNIVHGDVKLENVLLTLNSRRGTGAPLKPYSTSHADVNGAAYVQHRAEEVPLKSKIDVRVPPAAPLNVVFTDTSSEKPQFLSAHAMRKRGNDNGDAGHPPSKRSYSSEERSGGGAAKDARGREVEHAASSIKAFPCLPSIDAIASAGERLPSPTTALHIKLIDFSSSSYSGGPCYSYIQSRYYRAPEVILNAGYDTAIDLWSTGCVLAELLVGMPILPGCNEHHQLSLIEQFIGPVPPSLLAGGEATEVYYSVQGSHQRPYGVGHRSNGENQHVGTHHHDPPSLNGTLGLNSSARLSGVQGTFPHTLHGVSLQNKSDCEHAVEATPESPEQSPDATHAHHNIYTLLSRDQYVAANPDHGCDEYKQYFKYQTLQEIVRRCHFSEEEQRMGNGQPPYPSQTNESDCDHALGTTIRSQLLKQRFLFYDLLRNLLKVDPRERPTAAEALSHPFFSSTGEYMELFSLE